MSLDSIIEKRWKHFCKVSSINPDGQYAEETFHIYDSAYRIGITDAAKSMSSVVQTAKEVIDCIDEGDASLFIKVKVLKQHLEGLK